MTFKSISELCSKQILSKHNAGIFNKIFIFLVISCDMTHTSLITTVTKKRPKFFHTRKKEALNTALNTKLTFDKLTK